MVEYNPSLREAPDFSNAKVVALDIDGFLVETYLYEFAQSILMLRRYGMLPEHTETLYDDDFVCPQSSSKELMSRVYRASAGSNGDPIRHYQILLDREDLGPEFPAWHEEGVDMLKSTVFPAEGAPRLLEELAQSDKRTAIWTSRERKLVRNDLLPQVILQPGAGPRAHGYFDLEITADDVGIDAAGRHRLKPDTAGMEIIADHFGVDYTEIVMCGDRPSDATAASLGCMTISLASGFLKGERQKYWDAGSHAIVSDIREVHQLILPDSPSLHSI